MDLSRRRRALRALARGLTVAVGLVIVVLWAGAAQAEEPDTGSITVVVDASPNDAQDFTFTGCKGTTNCGPFTLDDDTDPTRSDRNSAHLAPGTYTVTQATVPNWAVAITCDTGESIDLANRRATIDLTAGEDVTCTFINTSASITIVQDSNPAHAHDFTYTSCLGSGCGTFTLDDDTDPTNPSSISGAGLAPGTYTITQDTDPNWVLTDITCTTGEIRSVANRQVTITLTAGEQTTCTFTNRAPSITIVQDSAPNHEQDFAYTSCLGSGCGTFTLDDDTDPTNPASITGQVLAAGTYTITQALGPPAWPLSSLSCTTSEDRDVYLRRATITLTAGEQTICTFKNAQDTRPAKLTLVEDTTPDGPQDFTFERCLDADCTTITLDDDNDPAHPRKTPATSLPGGVYTLSANAVEGYETAAITCTGAAVTPIDARRVEVRINPAGTVTCTFIHRPPQPPLTDVTQVSVGVDHTCAVIVGGQARCWGYDQDGGPLGDGGFENSTVPVMVESPDGSGPLTGVRSISAGFGHTCAALSSGEARCWGYAPSGLGDGTTAIRPRPAAVSNPTGTGPLTEVADIAAAAGYSCARLTTGEARCWGDNTAGELGDDTTTNRIRPVVVTNPTGTGPLTDVTQIAGGIDHTCALLESGQARCWGSNTDGRLGDGTTTNSTRPVAVSNPAGTGPLTGIAQIAVGYSQTCAALENGQAVCWGSNTKGQLGDGTTIAHHRPAVVSDPTGSGPLEGVTRLTAGATNTCARVDTGRVYCWGLDILDGSPAADHHRPFPVTNMDGTGPLTGVADVTGSFRHLCVLVDGGEVRCWGSNTSGNLGDGTTTDRQRPVVTIDPSAALEPLSDVTQLSTGFVHSCARLGTGEARCWGSTALGNPDYAIALSAIPVIDTDGSGPLTGVVAVSAGEAHTCAVRIDTGAVCWGANNAGQLGDGTTTAHTLPTPVLNEAGTAPLTGVVQIDAGADQTCATLSHHEARCWGAGAPGDGAEVGGGRSLPVAVRDVAPGVGPLTDVAQVSVGSSRACAALTTGEARCWGATPGDGTTTTSLVPVVVSNPEGTDPLAAVASVEAGYYGSCVVLTTAQARCWGYLAGDGALGPRTLPSVVLAPGGTAPMDDVVTIRSGENHHCATLNTGHARCWGAGGNQFGELGAPPPAASSLTPIVVHDPADGGPMATAAEVTPGRYHTCARLTTGRVRCWGLGVWDSLGYGFARTFRYTPANVVTPITPITPITP